MIDVVMIELLRTTGAARRFLAERVEPAVVHQILDDARFAPSGGNRQPWKVAVVEDRALRRQIGALMQGVWDDYRARPAGITPYNVVDDVVPGQPTPPRRQRAPRLDRPRSPSCSPSPPTSAGSR